MALALNPQLQSLPAPQAWELQSLRWQVGAFNTSEPQTPNLFGALLTELGELCLGSQCSGLQQEGIYAMAPSVQGLRF